MKVQTFTLDEEMSLMVELCSKMRVVSKIEIFMGHETRPISKMLYVSVPAREPGWVCTESLESLVRVLGEEKVRHF